MPGLAGWFGDVTTEDAFPFEAIESLLTEPFHQSIQIPGVNPGCFYLVHNGANATDQGFFHDPFTKTTIAYWGELYGDEFEHCKDGSAVCQVLGDLLGENPQERLGDVDGSFALFYQRNGRQLLAGDRIASRPVYYAERGTGFVVGPDLKLLASLRSGRPRLHRDAFVSFLVNGHPLSDSTYYEGVRLLRPGCYLAVGRTGRTQGEYTGYKPATVGAQDLGSSAYEEALAPLLRRAIRKRARYMNQAVIPVSGGFDSRGILACVREFYSGPLKTVSWGIHEDDADADASVGRKVAERFDTEHHFLRRKSELLLDEIEPMVNRLDAASDDCVFHHHEPTLMRQIRTELGCTVLFRGDECFGYMAPASTSIEALARVNVRELAHYPDLQLLVRESVRAQVLDEQRSTYESIVAACPCKEDWTIAKDWFYLQQRVFRSLNVSHYFKESVLQARNPWLDRDVLNSFSPLPVHYRYDKILYRRTLGKMFPDLMNSVPMARRHSLEDWGAVFRASREFQAYASHHLIESRNAIHEIYDPAVIAVLINSFFQGTTSTSWKVRALECTKGFLREKATPVYRFLRRNTGRWLTVRAMDSETVIARLLILKLWCDKWA
jgi:asparagine synthetase B (glutamine-hydrolysing)